jgi:protein phosphatase
VYKLSNYASRVELITKSYQDFKTLIESLLNELLFELNLRDRKKHVKLNCNCDVLFIGDVHGDYYTLLAILEKANAFKILRNRGYIVFLGDYIDRGDEQIKTLALLALLKTEWRDRVILLRGNHEPPPHLIPSPHDFPLKLIESFGSSNAKELYSILQKVFEALPLILYMPKKLIALHGGPPVTRLLKHDNPEDIVNVSEEDYEEVLWSDPSEDVENYEFNYIRGAGLLWGFKVTEELLRKTSTKIIIRGHEPCDGYKFNHEEKVLTLFSMKGYYGNQYAGALLINTEKLLDSNVERHIKEGIMLI